MTLMVLMVMFIDDEGDIDGDGGWRLLWTKIMMAGEDDGSRWGRSARSGGGRSKRHGQSEVWQILPEDVHDLRFGRM